MTIEELNQLQLKVEIEKAEWEQSEINLAAIASERDSAELALNQSELAFEEKELEYNNAVANTTLQELEYYAVKTEYEDALLLHEEEIKMIPNSIVYSVEREDSGIVVWAVQRALNDLLNAGLNEDSEFGEETEIAVKDFQSMEGLLSDGVFGPKSSVELSDNLESLIITPMPQYLLKGLVKAESNRTIGAVNWSVAGGVDCSYVQRRVLTASPPSLDTVRQAFNAKFQFERTAATIRSKYDLFKNRDAVKNQQEVATTAEWAWRLAALNHNYPAGADKISSLGIKGLSEYWTTPQDWVTVHGFKYTDGFVIQTPLHWCRWYALGAPNHNHKGLITNLVKDWNVS